jgi:hypothetical protein
MSPPRLQWTFHCMSTLLCLDCLRWSCQTCGVPIASFILQPQIWCDLRHSFIFTNFHPSSAPFIYMSSSNLPQYNLPQGSTIYPRGSTWLLQEGERPPSLVSTSELQSAIMREVTGHPWMIFQCLSCLVMHTPFLHDAPIPTDEPLFFQADAHFSSFFHFRNLSRLFNGRGPHVSCALQPNRRHSLVKGIILVTSFVSFPNHIARHLSHILGAHLCLVDLSRRWGT